jgi:hypothetical protein
MSPTDTARGSRRSILLGIPDAGQRHRVAAFLRDEGHLVVEASNAGEMRKHLDDLGGGSLDAIVCAGLLSEEDDPELAARLRQPSLARALVLLPTGGMLSTASRAERLGASAVPRDMAGLRRLLAGGESADRDDAPLPRNVGAASRLGKGAVAK